MLRKLLPWVLFFSLLLAERIQAHPADISYLRAKVERQRVELRFSFTLLTLGRIVALDRNQNQRLDKGEMELVRSELTGFLQKHVMLKLNDRGVQLGEIVKLEALWPSVESVDLREVDRAVDVSFKLACPEVIGSVWMEFTSFPQMGEEATIQATYEQGDLRMQVPFSRGEPDYRYDTGFAVEDVFQKPVSAPKQSVSWQPVVVGVLAMIGLWIWRSHLAKR